MSDPRPGHVRVVIVEDESTLVRVIHVVAADGVWLPDGFPSGTRD